MGTCRYSSFNDLLAFLDGSIMCLAAVGRAVVRLLAAANPRALRA